MAYVRIGGVDLYSETAGAGEPVLLLHGGFCSLGAFRPQAQALAGAGHRVFAYERPGHGRSADIAGEYHYARGVAEAVAYLDATGVESAHVVGYSDGAIIGLLLALDHPERVRSLVAISANLDPSAFAGADDGGDPAGDSSGSGGGGGDGAGAGPAPEAEPKPDVERLLYERLSPDGPAHADVVLGKLFRLWTTEPHIDPADLARVAAPVLVMAGDRDSIRPDHTLLIAASLPAAQLCIVPAAGHGLVAEYPDLISRLILEFLGRVA